MNYRRKPAQTRLICLFLLGALVAFVYQLTAEQRRTAARRQRKAQRQQRVIDLLTHREGISAWLNQYAPDSPIT